MGRILGVKSVFSGYTGEAGSGKEEGRIRPTPKPTLPYASKRDGVSADPRRCIAVDVGGAGSISENRTRLFLRDRQIDKVSPVLELTESRSSLCVELCDGRRSMLGDLHLVEHYLSARSGELEKAYLCFIASP